MLGSTRGAQKQGANATKVTRPDASTHPRVRPTRQSSTVWESNHWTPQHSWQRAKKLSGCQRLLALRPGWQNQPYRNPSTSHHRHLKSTGSTRGREVKHFTSRVTAAAAASHHMHQPTTPATDCQHTRAVHMRREGAAPTTATKLLLQRSHGAEHVKPHNPSTTPHSKQSRA